MYAPTRAIRPTRANQNNRKIKKDNNSPERISIKKNSVVNSESKNKYNYI